MGIRDRVAARVQETAATAVVKARDVALSQTVGPRLLELLEMESDRPLSIETMSTLLVRAVRDDDDSELAHVEVTRAAKRRQRILGAAGMFGGMPGIHLSSLYCEVVLLCDVERMHRLGLTDDEVAAHLLVLWNIMPEHDVALAAIDGSGPTVFEYVQERAAGVVGDVIYREESLTKLQAIKLVWSLRGVTDRFLENVPGSGRHKHVVFPASRVKEVIARAERQLGIVHVGRQLKYRPLDLQSRSDAARDPEDLDGASS